MKKVLPAILCQIMAFMWILRVEPAHADSSPLSGVSGTFKGSSNWQSVEKILGRPGIEQGDMFKITFPRTDLNVTVNGIPLEPGMALTSWFAFKSLPKGTLVMGELVLLDPEVPKAQVLLVKNGFQVIALHSLLLNESPSVKILCMSGHGSKANLAEALKKVLSYTGPPQPLPASFPKQTPVPTPDPSMNSGQSWSKVQAVLGPGKTEERLLQYTFPRAETIVEKDVEIAPFMGMATCINIQKVGGLAIGTKEPFGLPAVSKPSRDVVAATGNFVLTAGEVNPVVESMTQNHITVTAIHSHLLGESPRLFFLYFWALGAPEEVAAGLKEALGKVHLAGNK